MRTWVSRLWMALEIVRARGAGRRWWVEFDGEVWGLAVERVHVVGGEEEARTA